MAALEMDPAFAERNVNEGFSGGEKKRHEILQMRLLKPRIAILDETDSGLDVDALRVVSEGVNRSREDSDVGVLLITHYTRILRYIKPDFVHVFVAGKIVDEGGSELADKLENEGYAAYVKDSNEQASLRRRPRRCDGMTQTVSRPARGAHAAAPGRRGDPGGLPDPDPHRAGREAAGLPRLRGHLAEAAPGARRRALVLREHQRRAAPGRAPARRGGDRRLRGRPRHDRRVHRGARAGDRLHPQQHRGDQPRRLRAVQRGHGKEPEFRTYAVGQGDEIVATRSTTSNGPCGPARTSCSTPTASPLGTILDRNGDGVGAPMPP